MSFVIITAAVQGKSTDYVVGHTGGRAYVQRTKNADNALKFDTERDALRWLDKHADRGYGLPGALSTVVYLTP